MSTTIIYEPALRLQATYNAPLRGGEQYQFGFYDAGMLRAVLDYLGPDHSYQVWSLPIPRDEDQFAEAISYLHASDVQYALVDKDKIVYVTIDGPTKDQHHWLSIFTALGYEVHSGPKTSKRLKSGHRPTLLNAEFAELNVVYVEPTEFSKYDFSNDTDANAIAARFTDPEVIERLLDGGFVISRRLVQAAVDNLPAYDLGATSDPHDYYYDPRIRKQLVNDLLTANVFNARLVFDAGFLKGNCFAVDLPEGIDVITARTNIKHELTYANGFRFQAEPQGPKTRVFTDDQTVGNLPKLFDPTELEYWLQQEYEKMFNDAINNRLLTNWKYVYQRMWRDKDDLNENEARARMAYVGYRWTSAGFKLTESPWLFETTAISQAKPMQSRIPIPCSVYEQIIPESLARMAGYEITVDEGEIVRLNELGVHVVDDLDWLEMYESHGGHDQDDFFKLFYRTMDGGDYDGERVVIAMRSPNGYGEYSVFRYVEGAWAPKWHTADGTQVTFPVVDGTDWPVRLSDAIHYHKTVVYRGLPSAFMAKVPRSGPYTPADVIRDIKIAMAGGNVGSYVNAAMVHADTIGTHRPVQLCSLEDAIDKCINPDNELDVAAIDAEAKAIMREVINSGLPVDAVLWTTRGSRRFLRYGEELQFTNGVITQLYTMCSTYFNAYSEQVRAWAQANARPPQIIHDLGARLYHWSLPFLRDFRSAVYDRNSSDDTRMSGRIHRGGWEDLYQHMVTTLDRYERIQDKYDYILGLYSATINIPTTANKITDQIVMNRFMFPWLEAALQYYGVAEVPMYDVHNGQVDVCTRRNDEWFWIDADGVQQVYTNALDFQNAHSVDSPIVFTMEERPVQRRTKSLF